MPYDPNLPQAGTEIDADQMRAQLQGLQALINAVVSLNDATVDATNTLPGGGDPANMTVFVTGTTLHFSFDIPAGPAGADGASWSDGAPGPPGPEGPQGVPGEVTLQQLTDAIADTSRNCTTVSPLSMTVSDPPTQPEVQSIVDKVDELIAALQRF